MSKSITNPVLCNRLCQISSEGCDMFLYKCLESSSYSRTILFLASLIMKVMRGQNKRQCKTLIWSQHIKHKIFKDLI